MSVSEEEAEESERREASSRESGLIVIALGGLLLFLVGGVLILVAKGLGGNKQGLATVLGGFGSASVVIGVILPFLEGGIELGPQGVRMALRKVEQVDEELRRTQQRLDRLFLLTMSDTMYYNLDKLARHDFPKFKLGPGLQRELNHLRDIGYIKLRQDETLTDLPKEGSYLSQYIEVTERGCEFIELCKANGIHHERISRATSAS